MFRKLISNLPFSPSLINQLGFYAKRLKKEQFTRRVGLVFTILALIVQTLSIVAPAKATLAASSNDIIFGGGNQAELVRVVSNGCDTQHRCDIKAIYGAYGINPTNLAAAKMVNIYSSTANNYWSIGRYPRGYGDDIAHKIPGGPTIYARTLHGWVGNRSWPALQVQTSQGTRWILTECGNIVTQENTPKPKQPDIQVTKKVDNAAPLKGQSVKYTVTVKNNGPGVAKGLQVRDTAPSGLTFTAVSGGAGAPTVAGGREMKNTQPFDLGVGKSVTYIITARLNVDGPARFDNTACALDTNGDTNGSNNCGTATILVRPVCPLPGKQNLPLDDKNCSSPKLKIEKTADKTDLKVGDEFNYTLKVTNTGDTDLPTVVVRDVAPAEIEFEQVKEPGSASFTNVTNKRDYTSKVFALKKGASVTIVLKARVIKSSNNAVINQACVLSTGTGTTAGGCDDEKITIKDTCPSNPGVAKDSPQCQPCTVPGKENIQQSNPDCKACDETKKDTDGTDISCLELHKKASNITQQINNANGTTAHAGDSIQYTLSVKNLGKEVRKGFVMEENIGDVLEYADLVDANGATFTSNPVPLLSWAPVDIKPNETITRTVLVRVKSPIPTTPASTSDPLSYDLKLVNMYGDTVQINLPSNPIKTTEQTITTLPSTGLGTNIIISTVLLMSATYFYFRSKLMVKELGLVRQEFNYGAGV